MSVTKRAQGCRQALAAALVVIGVTAGACAPALGQQAAASATASAARRQSGTVEAISPQQVRLKLKSGESVTLPLGSPVTVLQVAPGSTDLKSAQPATLADVMTGDSVLVTGVAAADSGAANGGATNGGAAWAVRRIVLLKATAIAQRREQEEAGWAHSLGGIVKSVDVSAGTLVLSARGRETPVTVGPETIVRRYAPGSVRFEDAKRAAMADIRVGDQIRVRGERGEAAATGGAPGAMRAQEIVVGSFQQLSGVLTAVDAGTREISFKDLRGKKAVTVEVPQSAAVHRLPAEQAQRFAARERQHGTGGASGQQAQAGAGANGAAGEGGARGGGQDLSQVVSALPAAGIGDLKVGDAVMVVGMPADGGKVLAITVLAGVEPILAAAPNGAEATLAPWSVGGGAGAEQ